MDNPDEPKDQFSESLPLPNDSQSPKPDESQGSAAAFVRKKVAAAFKSEPSIETEASDIKSLGQPVDHSKHQQFIYQLTSGGKSLIEIQAAWHEYYAGLSDLEKHQVWQEFYATHSEAADEKKPPAKHKSKARTRLESKAEKLKPAAKTLNELRLKALRNLPNAKAVKPKRQVQSLLFGLGIGAIAMLIILFSFFNERFIAPFIQPSRALSNTPLITDTVAASSAPEVIIPKINVEIPVVYGVGTIDELSIDNALEEGVVHYADTAVPGQNGNVVIVGHSSNNIFNKGKYKFAFVLLSRMDTGDTFYLQKDGKRYTYQVYEKKIIKPTDTSILTPAAKPAVATLITCDPPGTSLNRLVVVGEQISPDPSGNSALAASTAAASETKIVPGNAPSLWSHLTNWFTQ